jgi:S-adenosylmethionine:tRNA ribosyltransferase-isomerase
MVTAKNEDGSATVRFNTRNGESLEEVARKIGTVPLPPYIQRADPQATRALDLERYQTVYADSHKQVAVAAPTAGLHFTEDLLAILQSKGVSFEDLTLHVGLGTFKPISTDTIQEHEIHHERYEVPVSTQKALFMRGPGRRVAVGTTSVRTIEDYLAKCSAPGEKGFFGEASLFIYPPRVFRGVDALITNFHQPRSTLLCLVAAFLSPGSEDGIPWLKEIYSEAVAKKYRFFSYGDAMLII